MTAPWRNPLLTVTTCVTGAGDYPDQASRLSEFEAALREQIAHEIEEALGECELSGRPCPVCEAMMLAARIALGTATVIVPGVVEDPR